MATLTPEQVTAELAATPGWQAAGGELTQVVTRENFRDALLFVNAVGYLAERANHHPDILINWNKVTPHAEHALGGRAHRQGLRARPPDQRPGLTVS